MVLGTSHFQKPHMDISNLPISTSPGRTTSACLGDCRTLPPGTARSTGKAGMGLSFNHPILGFSHRIWWFNHGLTSKTEKSNQSNHSNMWIYQDWSIKELQKTVVMWFNHQTRWFPVVWWDFTTKNGGSRLAIFDGFSRNERPYRAVLGYHRSIGVYHVYISYHIISIYIISYYIISYYIILYHYYIIMYDLMIWGIGPFSGSIWIVWIHRWIRIYILCI